MTNQLQKFQNEEFIKKLENKEIELKETIENKEKELIDTIENKTSSIKNSIQAKLQKMIDQLSITSDRKFVDEITEKQNTINRNLDAKEKQVQQALSYKLLKDESIFIQNRNQTEKLLNDIQNEKESYTIINRIFLVENQVNEEYSEKTIETLNEYTLLLQRMLELGETQNFDIQEFNQYIGWLDNHVYITLPFGDVNNCLLYIFNTETKQYENVDYKNTETFVKELSYPESTSSLVLDPITTETLNNKKLILVGGTKHIWTFGNINIQDLEQQDLEVDRKNTNEYSFKGLVDQIVLKEVYYRIVSENIGFDIETNVSFKDLFETADEDVPMFELVDELPLKKTLGKNQKIQFIRIYPIEQLIKADVLNIPKHSTIKTFSSSE